MNVSEHRDVVRLVAPDLGVAGAAVSLWLVPTGAEVVEGDRVVELVAGGVTVDLGAPVTGRLVAHLVDEDAAISPGTVLAESVGADRTNPARMPDRVDELVLHPGDAVVLPAFCFHGVLDCRGRSVAVTAVLRTDVTRARADALVAHRRGRAGA